MSSADPLSEQIAYYRARAAEYDDWWERRGRYDEGPMFTEAWRRDIDELSAWLDEQGALGNVLELAAGTGNWTRELQARASSVTAVDTAPEVLEINRRKVPDPDHITYVAADLFDWTPPQTYDTVFFGFWISHVPPERWESFWTMVAAALAPSGMVLFCDNAAPDRSDSRGSTRRVRSRPAQDQVQQEGREIRTLADGSRFQIIKRYWAPEELVAELDRLGWSATCAETSFAFLYGSARP